MIFLRSSPDLLIRIGMAAIPVKAVDPQGNIVELGQVRLGLSNDVMLEEAVCKQLCQQFPILPKRLRLVLCREDEVPAHFTDKSSTFKSPTMPLDTSAILAVFLSKSNIIEMDKAKLKVHASAQQMQKIAEDFLKGLDSDSDSE
eukprot:m.223671 g.223671  ORF g.223671 m.223671 type:complete len:144 (-) comp54187_c0_seq54:20-451(-)